MCDRHCVDDPKVTRRDLARDLGVISHFSNATPLFSTCCFSDRRKKSKIQRRFDYPHALLITGASQLQLQSRTKPTGVVAGRVKNSGMSWPHLTNLLNQPFGSRVVRLLICLFMVGGIKSILRALEVCLRNPTWAGRGTTIPFVPKSPAGL